MDLVNHLHNQGIAYVGTVCANRLPNCKMTPDAAMKKRVEKLLNCGVKTMMMWN